MNDPHRHHRRVHRCGQRARPSRLGRGAGTPLGRGPGRTRFCYGAGLGFSGGVASGAGLCGLREQINGWIEQTL